MQLGQLNQILRGGAAAAAAPVGCSMTDQWSGGINTAACSFSRSLSPLGSDSRQHTCLTAKYLSLTWRLSFLTEAQLLYKYVDYSSKNRKMVVFVDLFTRLEFVIERMLSEL